MFQLLAFQFHKGAIRTDADSRAGVPSIDFNSIKVRLERLILVCDLRCVFHFNSIKVRLELKIL